MTKGSVLYRLHRLWHRTGRSRPQGFTLIELLIVTLIGSGIVSGLVYIVVELMGADQRESSLSETQREMQLAMDYMSSELREAVYVYTGECIAGASPVDCNRGGNQPLWDFLPSSLRPSNQSVPVLAFWRQYPIPEALNESCGYGPSETPPPNVPCITAHSYALVVYSLTNKSDPTWRGRARITRYALTQFNNEGTATPGWVDPNRTRIWGEWPYGPDASQTIVNLQTSSPTGNPAVLVDFVDDGRGGETVNSNLISLSAVTCPNITTGTTLANPGGVNPDYSLSPTPTSLTSAGLTKARTSFYACVAIDPETSSGGNVGTVPSGTNQDVLVYLRGNAFGRPGINRDSAFLPTLETRVLTRGVLGRSPIE